MENRIIFGIDADLTTGTFQRLGDAVGRTPGIGFDDALIFGGRKRCNLTNDGVVLAYYGDEGYTELGTLTNDFIKDGKTYPAGTTVQVMVKQPKFYYKVEPIILEPIKDGIGYHLRRARWWVSESKQDGFKLHPNFERDGRELEFIYYATYEACIFDMEKAIYYKEDEKVFSEEPGSTLMLSSVTGVKPASGSDGQKLTRANGRVLSGNRGAGWQLIDCLSLNATEILMLIEYASFNSKKVIGNGVVGKEPGSKVNYAEKTGQTSCLGNNSGNGGPNNGFSSVTYRGEENLWGNIWKIVEGLNFECKGINNVWWSDGDYRDDYNKTPYRNTGFTLCKENGFTSAFGYSEECDFMFLPSEAKGTEEGPVGDYFKQKHDFDGYQISLIGGRWSQGTWPGLFFWYADCATENSSSNIGYRIIYIPQN